MLSTTAPAPRRLRLRFEPDVGTASPGARARSETASHRLLPPRTLLSTTAPVPRRLRLRFGLDVGTTSPGARARSETASHLLCPPYNAVYDSARTAQATAALWIGRRDYKSRSTGAVGDRLVPFVLPRTMLSTTAPVPRRLRLRFGLDVGTTSPGARARSETASYLLCSPVQCCLRQRPYRAGYGCALDWTSGLQVPEHGRGRRPPRTFCAPPYNAVYDSARTAQATAALWIGRWDYSSRSTGAVGDRLALLVAPPYNAVYDSARTAQATAALWIGRRDYKSRSTGAVGDRLALLVAPPYKAVYDSARTAQATAALWIGRRDYKSRSTGAVGDRLALLVAPRTMLSTTAPVPRRLRLRFGLDVGTASPGARARSETASYHLCSPVQCCLRQRPYRAGYGCALNWTSGLQLPDYGRGRRPPRTACCPPVQCCLRQRPYRAGYGCALDWTSGLSTAQATAALWIGRRDCKSRSTGAVGDRLVLRGR